MPRPIHEDEVRRPILEDTNSESEERKVLRSGSLVDNELQEPLTGCGASACCDPSSTLYRFIALILMCLVGFGELIIFYLNFLERVALPVIRIQDLRVQSIFIDQERGKCP